MGGESHLVFMFLPPKYSTGTIYRKKDLFGFMVPEEFSPSQTGKTWQICSSVSMCEHVVGAPHITADHETERARLEPGINWCMY